MTKTLFSIVFSFFVIHVYAQKPGAPPRPVGGNKDAHGCYTSAGYTWSQLRRECVQVWTIGEKLMPVNNQLSYVATATVLVNDAGSIAEVFAPEESKSFLLKKVKNNTFKNKVYLLVKTDKGWTLSKGGKAIYATEAEPKPTSK